VENGAPIVHGPGICPPVPLEVVLDDEDAVVEPASAPPAPLLDVDVELEVA
jgi:hypothetical protein